MDKAQPAIHEGNALNRDIIWMTMPLFLMSFFFYGPRPILLAIVAVITALVSDRVASMLRSRPYDKTENSSVVIALIIVLMMPASVQYRVVVVAVLAGVLVAKWAFGGVGSYPFNPSAVGFCVAAVSGPEQMLRYPQPQNWLLNLPPSWAELYKLWTFNGATLMESPSYTLKNGAMPSIDNVDILLGNFPGGLGATCCLVIAACAVFLIVRRRLPLIAPAAFLAVIVIIAFIFPRYTGITFQTWPYDIIQRLNVVKHELFSSTLFFMAVFLVTEPGTLPKNNLSRLIYGALLGFATMMFRYFGTYELGTCFAFLLINALSGFFDRAIARGAVRRRGTAS